MKRFKNIKGLLAAGISLVAVSLLTGCTKELNQTPQSTASTAAIFGSTDGLQLYANSFYDGLASAGTIIRGDDQYGDADYGVRSSPASYLIDGSFSSRQSSGWSWTTLRNINYFIANVSVPNANISQTVRENYIGLARFFRAYFYYGMVQQFGNVPWIGKPLGTSDSALYATQTNRTIVIDSVIADLDYAAQHITLSSDATASQVTKWVAYGLKSRICLFEGTFREYQQQYGLGSTVQDLLTQAAAAAKAVMDSSGYTLNATGGTNLAYRNVFISASPIASEVMLSDVMSSALTVTNDANWYYTSSTYGTRYSLTRDFINMYLNKDGSRFTDNSAYTTMGFYDETQNRDPRLAQTIRTPGYTRTSGGATVATPPSFQYSLTGYQPIKWCLDDVSYDGGGNTNSVCLMRYAEILLNYAEAVQELANYGGGGLSDADWSKTIGALRTRAGLTGGLTKPTVADPYLVSYFNPTKPVVPGDTSVIVLPKTVSDPVLLEIRRERSTELVLEGFRFADLSRWKLGVLLMQQWKGMYVPAVNTNIDLDGNGTPDVNFYTTSAGSTSGVTYINVGSGSSMTLSNGTSGQLIWLDNTATTNANKRIWHDFKYLYPIPYSELLLNPNLVQNPGW